MPTSPEGVIAPQRFPVKTWLIAFAGWMFDFYDLVLFSVLLVPIGRELHLTDAQEAVLLGVALGASGIGGIVFGYLSDVYGRKRVMTWTICLYSVGTALTAFSTGPGTIVVFRLLTGLGIGGEWAVGHALMAESSPLRMRGRASALLQAGEPFGVALAAVVGLLGEPLIGWRAVFIVSSASASVAIVVRRHLPESSLWHRQHSERLSPTAALREIARRRLLGPLVKGWVLGVFKLGTYWTCYTWLPKFLQTQGHQSITRSALWMVTAQAGQFLGMMAFGFFADRYGRRRSFAVYSTVTAAALYPLAFHWNELLAQPLLFWAALFTLGLGSGCTAGFGALLAELFPPIIVNLFVVAYGLKGGLSVPLVLAVATGTWVWTLPETLGRDLSHIGDGPAARR
jgi:MFS family permease